jgi:hypothetical protein
MCNLYSLNKKRDAVARFFPRLAQSRGFFRAGYGDRPEACGAMALAKEYPPAQMRIVQAGFEKEDLLAAAATSTALTSRQVSV